MNPFDLPGPQFLGLYAGLGLIVLALLYQFKQSAEAGEPGRLPVSDPYLIAYLRGGPIEAVRLGIAVLVDRQLLAIGSDDTVVVREGATPMHGSNDLERAILQQCARPEHPRDIAASERLQGIAKRTYEPGLVTMGLIAGPDVQARRRRVMSVAIAVLVVVAGIKIVVGLARNRPVLFLVVSAAVFTVLTVGVMKGRRTVRGDRILADLRVLFDALRGRAKDMRPYSATSELALLMAVFGLEAVPMLAFPFGRVMRPEQASSSSCGTTHSCGSSSSDGGGGGGCGGGGGGCGGCGSS
jgi:uncharacterized protein (TIGR04222 family)